MPTPAPTLDEIELTREVLALKSYSDTKSRIEALEPPQWAVQQADNALWTANRNSVDDVKRLGEIEFFENPDSILSKIRNRSRLRFGLAALTGEASDADAESAGQSLVSTLRWF